MPEPTDQVSPTIPPDTDEFPLGTVPRPCLGLTKKAAEVLFRVLNQTPLKDGQEVILVGDDSGNVDAAITPDGMIHIVQ